MGLKKTSIKPTGYYDWTVYPLEGIWDITEEAKKTFNGTINKDDLVFTLMIRQPDFVASDFVETVRKTTQEKKPHPLLGQVKFECLEEGKCVQMLHLGPYDDEPATFAIMEKFTANEGLTRVSKIHREIYLTDARKVTPEKYKTVLRFNVTS